MSEQVEDVEQPSAPEETPEQPSEQPSEQPVAAEAQAKDTPTQDPEPPAPAPQEVKSEKPPAPAPQEEKEEEVKSKETAAAPAPKPAPPAPEFHVVKAGYVQRQGLLWKKWTKQWMSLDEGGAALRWYKNESRAGNDGTLYMNKCAEVCDPREGATTTWPEGVTPDCCFVVCSPNRAFYLIADTVEDKNEWVAKLIEAKDKYNTTGVKVVSLELFSVEAVKVALTGEADRAQTQTDATLAEHGTSTDQVGKDLEKTAQDAEKELKKDETVQQVAKETEQAPQQVESEVTVEGGAKVEVTAEVVVEEQRAGEEVTAEVVVEEQRAEVVVEEPAPAEEGEQKEE